MFRILKNKIFDYKYFLNQPKLFMSDSTKGLSKIIDDVNSREISKLIDVDIINFSTEKIFFKSYTERGFTLSNNIQVNGGVTALSNSVFFWNVLDIENVNEESLELISVLEPKIDIVIIGKGPRNAKPDFRSLTLLSKKLKINFEILPTAEALATFNFLNYEDRNVAAFLLPVKSFMYLEEDQADIMKIRRKNLDMFRDSMSHFSFGEIEISREFLFPSKLIMQEKPSKLSQSIQSIAEEAKQLYIDMEHKQIKIDNHSDMTESIESSELKKQGDIEQINSDIKSNTTEENVSKESRDTEK